MRSSLKLLTAFVIIAASGTIAAVAPSDALLQAPIVQQLAVPSYIHPNASPEDWIRLGTSTPGSVGIAVANVTNGPDYVATGEWASVIHAVHANGVQVIGYVDTGYLGTTGQRTRLGSTDAIDWISQIQRDVDAWFAFYGSDISGIFFDQGQNSCGPEGTQDWVTLYRELNAYVKRAHAGATTVLNPGTIVPACYADSADVLVTFEGSYESYVGDPSAPFPYAPLPWNPVDPKKIWHIVYGATSTDQMAAAVALSKARSAGYVYITDDVLVNPYDKLPPESYWLAEQAAATQLPGGTLLPPSTPQHLDSTEYTSTAIDLEWMPSLPGSAPVVAYDIWMNGVRFASVPATVTTYRAADLTPQTEYVFTVTARDSLAQLSAASAPLVESTDETHGYPPDAPTQLVAVSTDHTSTVLTWQHAKLRDKKNGPWVESFLVLQNGRPILHLPGWATRVTVGKLAPGAAYQFAVIAVDSAGDPSPASVGVAVTTPSLPDGRAITNVSVTATPEQLDHTAEFLVPFAFRRVFIATGDPTHPCWWTGSEPQMCADFVIENDRLLRYIGSGTDWEWEVVRSVQPSINGDMYTWSIAPADIGSPAAPVAVFNANGYAPNVYFGTDFAYTSSGPPLPYE